MRRLIRQALVLLLLAVLPAIGAGFFHPKRPSWTSDEVQLATAQEWGDKVLWIDARSALEYDTQHIPGALHLSEEAWDDGLGPVLDQWEPGKIVVVYCSTLSCETSHEVAKRLREEVQLKEVWVLQGGWEVWRRAHP